MTTFIVPENTPAQPLKDFLRKICGISLTGWRKIKQSDSLKINGIITSPGRAVIYPKDIITYELCLKKKNSMQPMPIPIDIIFEDEYLLVINKPANMLVHPTTKEHHHTLANAVLFHYQKNNLSLNYHPVHRLDKNTSGLVLIAKYPHIQHQFSHALENKLLARNYIAIIQGNIANENGIINLPIARHPNSIIERIVSSSGQEAITHYQVVERYLNACQIKLSLKTGRTHQIRVHFAHIGHPVVNDPFYGYRRMDFPIEGQALHSKSLDVKHPITGEEMHFEAPIPADFKACLEFAKTYREDKRK